MVAMIDGVISFLSKTQKWYHTSPKIYSQTIARDTFECINRTSFIIYPEDVERVYNAYFSSPNENISMLFL